MANAYADRLPIGSRHGMLTVLGVIPGGMHKGRRHVAVKCDCGRIATPQALNVAKGQTRSCGCQRGRVAVHGYTRVGKIRPEWQAWNHMIQRCTNPNDKHYKDYGARGIRVCPQWATSFTTFLQDMGDRPGQEYSLDRIDSNADYSPSNCRWADRKTQAQNRRTVIWIGHDGQRRCVAEWSRVTGIKRATLLARYHRGWTADRILSPAGCEV